MKFEAVTTFNADGRDLYGRRMMATFADHWPADVPLRVYAEGWQDEGTRDLLDASPWLGAFKAKHKARRFRDFRWDAVRFAHKVAAVMAADEASDADVLIWMDGDTVTHSPVDYVALEGWAPRRNEWIAWLDRKGLYPECGFYLINRRHPAHRTTMLAWRAMYETGALFTLPEHHDSYVLMRVVEDAGVGTKSLSGKGKGTAHPLVNGPLGAWFDHLKGNRKTEGRSRASDLRVARAEAYWR